MERLPQEAQNEGLKQLLRYMEESTFANAVNDDLKEVHRMVKMLKIDSETTICCFCMRLTVMVRNCHLINLHTINTAVK